MMRMKIMGMMKRRKADAGGSVGRMQFVLRSWHCRPLLVCYMLNSCFGRVYIFGTAGAGQEPAKTYTRILAVRLCGGAFAPEWRGEYSAQGMASCAGWGLRPYYMLDGDCP